MSNAVFFVSGIDTDIGKSFATGWLAKKWQSEGHHVITQKLVQTGNSAFSEDIVRHRAIMGCGFLPEDNEGLTATEIFSYPASPHLASAIDRRPINFSRLDEATNTLASRYDRVLIEGAGGLMVPLTRNLLTIDWLKEHHYPLVFVTSARLGSLNHTLLSLEAILNSGIELPFMLFNLFPSQKDKTIANDTYLFLQDWLKKHSPQTVLLDVPLLGKEHSL